MKPLSERQEQILLLLKKFDYLTRDQLRFYFGLKSVRNTNRVLNDLTHFISSIRDGYQSIYYLNKNGREYVCSEKIRKKGGHVQHSVMRNEFYQFYDCPQDWKNEVKVSDRKTTVIVDAMFTKLHTTHFLEVDNLQSMQENKLKINRYKDLFNDGALEQQLGHFPTLVWITTTELRRMQLKALCEELPVTKVFTYKEIKQ
ncbi:replication-relaxation family protein [Viridibacillus sp. FSL R5-0468]|uniref:replication-relaxation family protein n=1 Tax=Viridibacillus sp. FSL R5-0468 TaxID=2921640 RepID=UPI0030F78538